MEALTTIRPELLTLTDGQLQALMPYFLVFGGISLAIIASVLRSLKPKWPVFILGMLTTIAGICSASGLLGSQAGSELIFNGMMVSDAYSNFFNIVFLASAAFTLLSSFRYLDHEQLQHPEYYVLVLFSALGMMLMASALDLIVLFIALELMSLSVYVLVGFRRADRRCNEAAMKYFILGSAASAILLYGSALLYGMTGSTNIRDILAFVQAHPQGLPVVYVLGAWLVLVGFLFKVATVPFHMWMPDVYEGAPTPVTGFMTTGLKAAAFAAFVRVLISAGYGKGLVTAVQSHFHDILWVSAVLTMLVGNIVALTQVNLKRMLAYSSIAHSGYILVGMIAGPGSEQGYAPVVMYLVAYAVMNLGAFVVLTILAGRDDSGLNLQDLAGLSRRHPWLSFAMGVFMFSMAGIPPTAGFAAKYLLFYSAVQANEIPLVIIAVLCSAISVYYYLRVLVYIYMRDPAGSPAASRVSVWSLVAVSAMVVLTLQIGILPAKMVSAAKKAVTSL
ncbi:MAG: NADH-quinone oxidoreductase subunit N [Oligoflexia bacterium]|nr:NADH-quinone oxidoreductase subunit N [Oligoflexia bacterium]